MEKTQNNNLFIFYRRYNQKGRVTLLNVQLVLFDVIIFFF